MKLLLLSATLGMAGFAVALLIGMGSFVAVLTAQTPAGTPFRIERLDSALDERYLYVTAGSRRTLRYEILPDDTVANGRDTTSGGTPGRIQITSPEGKPLGRLHLPQPSGEPRARVCATNVAFGDDDDRGLYITACTHLFKIRTRVAGVRPGQLPH